MPLLSRCSPWTPRGHPLSLLSSWSLWTPRGQPLLLLLRSGPQKPGGSVLRPSSWDDPSAHRAGPCPYSTEYPALLPPAAVQDQPSGLPSTRRPSPPSIPSLLPPGGALCPPAPLPPAAACPRCPPQWGSPLEGGWPSLSSRVSVLARGLAGQTLQGPRGCSEHPRSLSCVLSFLSWRRCRGLRCPEAHLLQGARRRSRGHSVVTPNKGC